MSAVPSDSTLSTFTASDGDNLAVQDWPLPEGLALRGVIVLVHGLGEHAGRYDHVARRLNGWGFAVRGYDQYGHGESGGVRGALPASSRLLDDLADIVDSTRARMEPETPLILLGHSMGGLVASCFVAQARREVDALVLTSPALDPGLNSFQRMLLAIMPRVAPNFTVGNGLDVDLLSHDANVVSAYRNDARVHDRISGRLARFIADAGPWVVSQAQRWTVPTLLMYAGEDHLVNPQGSRDFAAKAPKEVVTVRCFDDLYHEVLNEPDARVFEQLRQWLDARF
ncbi:alpha/beta hydrolase [Ramlibacter albus]|uniref:Lysophospholipase n=1 Tax=Ramlibacter albus TaxID=2079448 RepID=A0A923M6Q0_9BURK|nr:alpha/beta hydrolase [Ramlibacter albus]MBC5763724.1 lysophospholipase [Ramlibacter albus]